MKKNKPKKTFLKQCLTSVLTAACLALCSAITLAEDKVYKTVDENGKVIFSDTPPAANQEVEEVEIKPINTAPATELKPWLKEEKITKEQSEYQLSISSPPEGYQMGPSERSLTVSVSAGRGLDHGHTFVLFLDGKQYGQASNSGAFSIDNPFRGKHSLSAQIRDENGRVLSESGSVTFFVIRPHLNR